MQKMPNTLADVIWRYLAVTIDSNNDLSFGLPESGIQPRGHNLSRVVYHLYIRVPSLKRTDDLSRCVVRHTISDQYFQAVTRIVLRSNRTDTSFNEVSLIANRHDH
jgi:hypothetical protein